MPNTTNRNRNTGSHSGHESVINTFARYGKRVTLHLVDGSKAVGQVKTFDRFTISLVKEGENYPTIFFKSAIVCFYSEEF